MHMIVDARAGLCSTYPGGDIHPNTATIHGPGDPLQLERRHLSNMRASMCVRSVVRIVRFRVS